MDFSGLSNLSQMLAQGYKDQLELQRQNRLDEINASNIQNDNLAKAVQVEAQYGPMTGVQTVDPSLLGSSPSAIDTIKKAAAETRGFRAKSTVDIVQPQGAPADDGPQASYTAPAAFDPTGFITGTVDRSPASAKKGKQQAPSPQDVAAAAAQQQALEAQQLHAKVTALGGTINDQGQILLPNHVANKLYDLKKAQITADAAAAAAGAGLNRIVDQRHVVTPNQMAPRGGGAPRFVPNSISNGTNSTDDAQYNSINKNLEIIARKSAFDKTSMDDLNAFKLQKAKAALEQKYSGQPAAAPAAGRKPQSIDEDPIESGDMAPATPQDGVYHSPSTGKVYTFRGGKLVGVQ